MLFFIFSTQGAVDPTTYIDIIAVVLGFLMGPLDAEILYLLLAMTIDTVFGIMVARNNNTWSLIRLLDLTSKKVMVYMLWIIMFNAFDNIAGLPNTARWSVIMILVGFEIISAVKNTSRLGYNRLANALENMYLSLISQQGGSNNDERDDESSSKDDHEKLDRGE